MPWVSVLFCGAIWALALRFSFERLISIDLVLYGAALLLEFVALLVLRRREPALARPFRIPGGLTGATLIGVGPAMLILYAMWSARAEHVAGMNALLFRTPSSEPPVAAVYALTRLIQRRTTTQQN